MPQRVNKPVSVTLGSLASRAEARVKSGNYASISEVVRAGLRALDREEAMLDAVLKAKVMEAISDPRPDLTAGEAFSRMDAFIEEQRSRGGR